MTNGTKWVFFLLLLLLSYGMGTHRALQVSTSAAKVAIDTLSWLIRPEPGTHYFRSKIYILRFSHIFFCPSFLLRSHSIVLFVTHNSHKGMCARGVTRLRRRRRRMSSRSPERQENIEFMDLLRFPYFMFEFSLQNTVVRFRLYDIFNGADRPMHA